MDVARSDDTPKGLVARIQMALSRSLRALQVASAANTAASNYSAAPNPAPLGAAPSIAWQSVPFTSTGGRKSVRIVATISGTCSIVDTAVTVTLQRGATPIGATTNVDAGHASGDFTCTLEWIDATGPFVGEVFAIVATAAAGTISATVGQAQVTVEERPAP